MGKSTLLILPFVALLTAGCSHKAEPGLGGMAEHDLTNMSDHPIGLENALYFEQRLSNRHLDDLILAGAKICFPAAVHTLSIRKNRIARELQGGLESDASNDLIIQRDQLARLERRLNYVQLQGTCVPNQADHKATSEPLKVQTQQAPLSNINEQIIHDLLNNNNQFVRDSAALNPRYIGQLAEVAQLLRGHPGYQLKITGHADTTGDASNNLTLSLQRAQQVERYLQIFGLSPNNIVIAGEGDSNPLFNGEQEQVQLVNRRVSIELINIHSTEKAD